MDRVFKSKVDWWYHLLLFILIVICFAAVIKGNAAAVAAVLLITALAVHAMLSTYYIITADGRLIAHCSIFPEKEIRIGKIEELERTIIPAPSYALSLNRIGIRSGTGLWLMASPQNEKDFIKLLKQFNPDIKLVNDTNFL
ncbi:MAG: PH domain-containing protein [Tannerellaceae bacterium]|jgi:general stress protein CsbA|nr:PH domain-containing protein [Tannerellaceae bacterium]